MEFGTEAFTRVQQRRHQQDVKETENRDVELTEEGAVEAIQADGERLAKSRATTFSG